MAPRCSRLKTRLRHWAARFSWGNDADADVNKGGYFPRCNPSAITSLILTETILPLNGQKMASYKCTAAAMLVFCHPIFVFPIPKYLFAHSWGIKQRPASQHSGRSLIDIARWREWGRKTGKRGDNNKQHKNCVQIQQGSIDLETLVTSV